MSDTISNVLTALRNAVRLRRLYVEVTRSNFAERIVVALKRTGHIWDYSVVDNGHKARLRLVLKYASNGDSVITGIERVSKPGCRIYLAAESLKPIRQGLGVSLVSTNKGVLSDREARLQRVGGEVICSIY